MKEIREDKIKVKLKEMNNYISSSSKEEQNKK